MSTTRYLEIDSTYRDRNKWTSPAEFEIPISLSGRKGRNDALDPVSMATPILTWKGNDFNILTSNPKISLTISTVTLTDKIAHANTGKEFIATGLLNTLHKEKDYYVSAVITNTTLGIKRKIVNYEWLGYDTLGNEKTYIVLDQSFGDGFSNGDSLEIDDPSDFTDINNPVIFVPCGNKGTNRYIDYIIYNQTRNEYRNIISYSKISRTIQINGSPVTDWETTDVFSLRKLPPCSFGAIQSSTISEVVLKATESSTDNIYYHYFLRITSGNANNEIRQINNYDGITKTVSVSFPFSVSPETDDTYEILQFSHDNACPFVYSGNVSQEEQCYEIQLKDLVVPNLTLTKGYGDRIAYYPYCYVELVNVGTSSSGNRNIIYSNNPNSVKSLFRTVVYDTSHPNNTNFVKMSGGGMKQTIKFKPNDTLKFAVKLHNGDLYTTDDDRVSPLEPNPEVQISACFSIRKI